MKLFITGFLQVFFVAVNTYFISKGYSIGVFVCGVLISLIWTYNVKKVSIGTVYERFQYSLGAGFVSLLGMFGSKFILNFL